MIFDIFLYIFGLLGVLGILKRFIPKKKEEEKQIKSTKRKVIDTKEPLAIIGLSCNFPKAKNKKKFLEMLQKGFDGVGEIPGDRWNKDLWYDTAIDRRSKLTVKKGGYVKDIDLFDAKFFKISPKEALRIDPQQRMLLEETYRTFEDAGYSLDDVSGTDVGVFVGIASHDYGDIQMQHSERINVIGHTITGASASIAANRISYVYNLKGPSVSYDTACSSSVCALNAACNSIYSGECSMSVVGGVSALLRPETTLCFSKGGYLSPDGVCKCFDNSANGYCRSEGCGAFLLKPLSQAIKDGDKIYSTVVITRLNQDGRTKGMAMPSQTAQERLIQDCIEHSKIDPSKFQYVEAHGTGTAVGDPIEANAIGNIYGKHQKGSKKLYIGSVKSNIGHLEACSAIAGVLKVSLLMKHQFLAKNLHYNVPNEKIDFKKMNLEVVKEKMKWPVDKNGEMYASLNSFGFGGTNGHVIFKMNNELLKRKLSPQVNGKNCYLFFLSAKSKDCLKNFSNLFIDYLNDESTKEISLRDICYTSILKRTHFKFRMSIVVRTKDELKRSLQIFVEDKADLPTHITFNKLIEKHDGVSFVFGGQGPQWFAMGRDLIKNNKIFKKWIVKIDSILKTYADWSIVTELTKKSKEESRIDRTEYAQPAIFSIQVALFELYKTFGVQPKGIVGHSIGEVAAAYASGHLSLENAVKVIYWRSKIQQKAEKKGRMLATGLSIEEAIEIIKPYKKVVSIAAENGPKAVVLSGDAKELEIISKELSEKEQFNRFLNVSVPFHSYHMEPLKKELIKVLNGLETNTIATPLYSTVTGNLVKNMKFDENYWYENVRKTVYFNKAIGNMINDEYRVFLEISPNLILGRGVNNIFKEKGEKGFYIHSLLGEKKQDEEKVLYESISKLHCCGYKLNFKKLCSGKYGRVDLPSYPFERKRFWLETKDSTAKRKGIKIHPFITSHGKLKETHIYHVNLDVRLHTWLDHHRVQGPIIYPGAGFTELLIGCGRNFSDDFYLQNITFKKALFLPDDDYSPKIQVIVHNDGTFVVESEKGSETLQHVTGRFNFIDKFDAVDPLPKIEDLKKIVNQEVDLKQLYKFLFDSGLQLGESFQCVRKLFRNDDDQCLGFITPDEIVASDYEEYNIHPTILDACFQTLFGQEIREEYVGVYVPINIGQVKFFKKPSRNVISFGRLTEKQQQTMKGEIYIYNGDTGELSVQIKGFLCRYIDGTKDIDIDISTCLFKWIWKKDNFSSFRKSDNYLPYPRTVENDVEKEVLVIRKRPEQKVFQGSFNDGDDKLILMYCCNAIKRFGFKFELKEKFNVESLKEELAILKKNFRLFDEMFKDLAKYGYMRKISEKEYIVIKEMPESSDHEDWYKELLNKFPRFIHELKLNRKCGQKLKEVLIGETDPVELLFPTEDWDSIIDFYQKSHSFKKYSEVAGKAVEMLMEKLPKDQDLRILEVGAGTGGLTSFVLPVLYKYRKRVTYCFSDISDMFLTKARGMFKKYLSFMEFDICNIEKPPKKFAKHSFDIIIASDVIHATQYIKKSLGQIQDLLSSGGIFIMLELTDPPIWVDFTFGLTTEWWHFKDIELRPDHPYMSKDTWLKTFKEMGFTETIAFSPELVGEKSQHVFLARNKIIEEEVIEKENVETGNWLIFDNNTKIGDYVISKLGNDNTCYRIVSGGEDVDFKVISDKCFVVNPKKEFHEVFKKVKNVVGVVYLWGLKNIENKDLNLTNVIESWDVSCLPVLNLVRTIFNKTKEYESVKKTFFIAHNAFKILDDDVISLTQTPMWGLVRTFQHEKFKIHSTLIDISSNPTEKELQLLVDEINNPENDREVGFRGTQRYVYTLQKHGREDDIEDFSTEISTNKSFHVEIRQKGSLDSILLAKKTRKNTLGELEVEIKVKASSLNFKDIMIATNLIHPDALKRGYTGDHFGMECSGIITRVGKSVNKKKIKVGDEVIAIASDSFSSFVVTSSLLTVKKPKNFSFQEASTILFPYITAYFSLVTQCRILKGEKVLIHSATGGVGIAAVNICKALGCEVIGTCSDKKRKFLEQLGVKHIYNSRNLGFGKKIEEKFGKIDVILNTLAGTSAIYKNLQILNDYGRFAEIGKKDIYDNNMLGLRPFGNNLSYFGIDIDKLLTHKTELCSNVIKEFMNLIKVHKCKPHPTTIFPISKVKEAFFYMAGSKHIGKVVIDFELDKKVYVKPATSVIEKVNGYSTYIISAGTGGFCYRCAKYLMERGAKHLALFSRSGVKSKEIQKDIDDLNKQGYQIVPYACDVSNLEDMKKMFDDIRSKMPKIGGILHGAMVLSDSLVADMTPEQLMVPVVPKVAGAWILHELTLKDNLQFFIMFSSISSTVGSLAQGNYASANMFLDVFCHHRRSMGLKGTTVNWGVIGEVGFVHRNKKIQGILHSQGWRLFVFDHIREIMDHLIAVEPYQTVAIRADWQALGETFKIDQNGKRFGHLFATADEKVSKKDAKEEQFIFSQHFIENSEEKRIEIITTELTNQLVYISGLESKEFDNDEPIINYGFDSLMTNHLRNWIQMKFNFDYPLMRFMKGVSINQLAKEIYKNVSEQVLTKLEKE